jgi:hypothetical protein
LKTVAISVIRKNSLRLLLPFIGFINVAILSKAYWNNSVPVGWDTPAYIHLTKLTLADGVSGLVQQSYYSHFYTIFSSFIVTLGLSDPFYLEIALPLALSVAAVMLTGFVMWKWFHDKNLTVFAAFFAVGWYVLFALISSIHRNLMAFVFLLVVLAYLPAYFERRSFALTMLFWSLGILMVFTHVETYIISVGLFVGYAVALRILNREIRIADLSMNLLVYLVPLAVGVVALLPFVPLFLAHYVANLATVESSVPILELPLYFGGQLLPLVILGLVSSWKEIRGSNVSKPPLALLLSWAVLVLAAAFIVSVLRMPLPQWRIIAFFPVPFLASLGLNFAIGYLRKRGNIGVPRGHHKLTLLVLILSIIIIHSWAAVQYTDAWMRPYISDETYQDLRWIEQNCSFSGKPIVVFYFKAGEYTDGTLALYRNWLNATIGPHYAYYGRLQYLLGGYSMPFQDQEYNRVSTRTLNELNDLNLGITEQPILIVSGDFYPRPSAYERSLLYEVTHGVFLLNSTFLNISDFYNVRLLAFRDSFSSSSNWYSAERYWASEGLVAEHSENSSRTEFNMTFSLPICKAGTYAINMRMFDYATTSAMVKVALDNVTLSIVPFGGSLRPRTFRLGSFFFEPGIHFLTLRVDDLDKAHQMSLDYVESILEK